jgi:small subunit ribosomal protein S17
MQQLKPKRNFRGLVVSDVMDKTIVVEVEHRKQRPPYQKPFIRRRRYKVHDERETYKAGDLVSFEECRPISKEKKWRVIYQNNQMVK